MPKAKAHHSASASTSSIETSVFADAYEFTIVDRAMEPRYRPGEVAQVSPRLALREGHDVFLQVETGRGARSYIGRLVSVNDEALRVSQFKPNKVLTLRREDIRVAHAVAGCWIP